MGTLFLASLLALPSISCASSFEAQVYNTKTKEYLDHQKFIADLPERGNIILGEFHYQSAIHWGQAQVIRDTIKGKNLSTQDVAVAWEFLNFNDQESVNREFDRYRFHHISGHELIHRLKVGGGDQADHYIPVLESTRAVQADLIGVNAPRRIKKTLMDMGMDVLPPEFQPPNFQLGSQDYFNRFKKSMENHVPEDKIEKYYLAQCYTDAVMAWKFSLQPHQLKFLVVGSFHSDFNDGVVDRISHQSRDRDTLSVKFVDRDQLSDIQLKELLEGSPEYGAYADFIYIVNPIKPKK